MKREDSRVGGWVRPIISRRQALAYAGAGLLGAAIGGTARGARTLPRQRVARLDAATLAATGEVARRADDFVASIGVATHLRYLNTPYAQYDQIVKPRLLEAGIRTIRDGDVNSDTEFFDKVRDLAASGVRAQLIMQPPDVTPAQAVQQVTGLKGAVVAIEGPNEPDNQPFSYGGYTIDASTGDFRAAIAYQRDLYQAMKSDGFASHVPVLVFSIGDPFRYGTDIGDISRWLDYGNMHSYSGGQEPTGSTNSLQDYIVAEQVLSGTKPQMASETGYFTAPLATDSWQSGISYEAHGKYIPRLYLEYFNADVARTCIYEFLDEGTTDTASEQNYGLLLADGTPKPAFTAVSNLIGLLQEPGAPRFAPRSLSYRLSGDLTNLHHTLLQRATGQFYLVLWLAVSSYDTTTKTDIETSTTIGVQFGQRMSRAALYDPLQSRSAMQTYQQVGEVTVDVPDHALVLEVVPEGGQLNV